jgi:hypothetical protein
MKRRVVLINVLIFAGVVIFAARFRSTWESFEQVNSLEGIVTSAQQDGGSAGPSRVEPMGQAEPFSQFVVVSQKTLFAESRRPQAEEGEVVVQDPGLVVEEPPKWAARPMLHGVSAVGSRRLGVMTVFEGNQKTGELRNVEVGDLVQGYWVDEIGETTLRLRWGDRDEIIDMADATKPAAAGRSGAAGKVTVIQVGAAPAAVQTRSAAEEPEGSSLEVSVVGASSAQGGGAQGGAARRQGAAQPARQGTEQDDGVQRFIEGR